MLIFYVRELTVLLVIMTYEALLSPGQPGGALIFPPTEDIPGAGKAHFINKILNVSS